MRKVKSNNDESEPTPYRFAVNIVIFLIVTLTSLLAVHVSTAKTPTIRVYVPTNSAIALSEKAPIAEEK